MSDHIEHKCSGCGSLLHHTEDCPECSKATNTPITDAFKLEAKSSLEVISDNSWAKRLLVSHLDLERENNQLRAELKQCAEALDKIKRIGCEGLNLEPPTEEYHIALKALSLPSVQAALKDNTTTINSK